MSTILQNLVKLDAMQFFRFCNLRKHDLMIFIKPQHHCSRSEKEFDFNILNMYWIGKLDRFNGPVQYKVNDINDLIRVNSQVLYFYDHFINYQR